MLQPPNRDYFQIFLDKKFKVGNAFYSNNLATNTGITNNDYRNFRYIFQSFNDFFNALQGPQYFKI